MIERTYPLNLYCISEAYDLKSLEIVQNDCNNSNTWFDCFHWFFLRSIILSISILKDCDQSMRAYVISFMLLDFGKSIQ